MNKTERVLKFWIILLFAILGGFFMSCTTSNQVAKFLSEKPRESEPLVKTYLKDNRPFFATECANDFPIIQSEETTTETERGNAEEFKAQAKKNAERADSLEAYINTLPVKPECTDEATARDRVIKDLSNTIRKQAQQLSSLKADVERTTKKVTKERTDKLDAKQAELETERAFHAATQKELESEAASHQQTIEDKNFWIWLLLVALVLTNINRIYKVGKLAYKFALKVVNPL